MEQRDHGASMFNADIGTVLPDLRSLLAVPAPAQNVTAGRNSLRQLKLVADHPQGPVTRACTLVRVAVGRGGCVVAVRTVPLAHHVVRF